MLSTAELVKELAKELVEYTVSMIGYLIIAIRKIKCVYVKPYMCIYYTYMYTFRCMSVEKQHLHACQKYDDEFK